MVSMSLGFKLLLVFKLMSNIDYVITDLQGEIIISQCTFRGIPIELTHCDTMGCEHKNVDIVHHYDDDMNHYCPTGYIMCLDCGGIGDEPDPPECTKWETK